MDHFSASRRAKALVQDIANKHGYLDDEFKQGLNPEQRRTIEEVLLRKDEMIGSSVITNARFVFELLQNADDNQYKKARESGTVPFVSYKIFSDKIILECNEDGFSSENLEAICSLGQSSKTGAQGYIGEKGIGFKSVFMVAWKVHIQSNYFSFTFTHKKGDSGMGMISPVWEETTGELESPMTRITLHLHKAGDEAGRIRESIRSQFEEFQANMLLLFRNIRKIQVEFYDGEGQQTSSETYSIAQSTPSLAALMKIKKVGTTTETETRHFRVIRHAAKNLSRNENRTYSESEEASRTYSTSVVILAFPVSESSVPIIEPQEIFAFLPVRPVGFNFLIQADFVTDANRQDIQTFSLRNHDLFRAIADAFIAAVMQIFDHSFLRYTWVKYLPREETFPSSSLWSNLVSKIKEKIKYVPVFYDHKELGGRSLSDLVRATPDLVDENGEPLLDDGDVAEIISRHYGVKDLDVLQEYGLQSASYAHFMRWLKADLANADSSRMKSRQTTKRWYNQVAKHINRAFVQRSATYIQQIKQMELLPLSDFTWASASSGPVYFPTFEGLEIPSGIGLKLLLKNQVDTPQRTLLFTSLGVQTASLNTIRQAIADRYKDPKALQNSFFSVLLSRSHLRFLYFTDHLDKESSISCNDFQIFDQQGQLRNPLFQTIYLPTNDPFGPSEVLKKTATGPKLGDGAPGYDAVFVNRSYFYGLFEDEVDEPAQPKGQEDSWRTWFARKFSVATHVSFDVQDLSVLKKVQYIQTYRPERFMECLVRWYQAEHPRILGAKTIRDLRMSKVLCRGNHLERLKYTYFPVQRLETRVSHFLIDDAFFPWLWLEGNEVHEEIPSKWKEVLSELSAGRPKSDLDFALTILEYSSKKFRPSLISTSIARLFDLYKHIQTKFTESTDRTAAAGLIRHVFRNQRCIYVPVSKGSCLWALPDECVWEAPQKMESKFALQELYQPWLSANIMDGLLLTHLFTTALGIGNCTWQILAEELRKLKDVGVEDIDRVGAIYRALFKLTPSSGAIDDVEIRTSFESEGLIFVPSDDGTSWHKTSECVWSSATKLRGRVSLTDDYEDLEVFFVDRLGVKPVDLSMAIDELKDAASGGSAGLTEIKESIWIVNSLLSSVSTPPSPKTLLKSPIFPIKRPDWQVEAGSVATEFCIIDREPLEFLFKDKVKLLDFTLKEIARLRPFIEWMQLQDRYISSCVKEITSFHGGTSTSTATLNPHRQIRNRAHALLRVAAQVGSPRCQSTRDTNSFYDILRSAQIFETDGISSDLSIFQDGVSHAVQGQRTTIHIDEENSSLKIYLPRGRDDQDYMFSNILPQKLLQWMMRHPVTHISQDATSGSLDAIKNILLAPVFLLTRALQDSGIAQLDVVNRDEVMAPSAPAVSANHSENNTGPVDDGSDPSGSSGSQPLEFTDSGDLTDSEVSATTMSSSQRRSNASPPRLVQRVLPMPSPGGIQDDTTSNTRYVSLLDNVISAGRRRRVNGLPVCGTFNMSQLQDNLPASRGDTDFGLRSAPQIERDCKIGAAGELFVYELLSHLYEDNSPLPQLPGFSRSSWQSTIRKYVTVHPEYANMPPWSGRETSDIVYQDTSNRLTALFIDKGYLQEQPRSLIGGGLKYFIEVKTTTMACETPFYMSKAQYQRMGDQVITENSDTVYAIFRVYNLGQVNMGYKVYLDPERLRSSGQLKFTAETWSVIPG
ncbi:hypothetical protein CSAL01_00114 [Colletotrichum salicis]|uniref:Protein NO VEIN C-terminal domain-containing protein n=1 Tax=Colletotrichum salicis TaxID=1209931 RepID=A0A135V827_9PEZI|nr:hypothetical protein CSAL01_00114 [Colletotrichum salicis]